MFGPAAGLEVAFRNRSDSMGRFYGETWLKTAGTPDGYGIIGLVPAIRSGAMSTLVNIATVSGLGDLLKGGPMVGNGDLSLAGDNLSLSLTTSMEGNSTITLSGSNLVLALTIGLDGNGTWSLTGDANALALIVPFEGTGGWNFGGVSDLRGRMTMSGEWTPFSELSPEGLANAVWEASAAAHNNAGTMGEKLNGAGSAGNPWTEVLESGLTAAEVMRIILAVQVGQTTITVTSAEGVTPVTADVAFKGQDGTTDRVLANMTGSERTTVTLEGN
jgi:hypothetical protein